MMVIRQFSRRQWFESAAALVLWGVSATASGAQDKLGGNGRKTVSAACSRACAACRRSCEACVQHCNAMVSAGMKEHEKTLRLSADCGAICAAAAQITSRQGPMSVAICEACAQACAACGAECAKFPDMGPMRDCAASCRTCEKACRSMIAALK